MDKEDFNEYLLHWKEALNPSNQIFHNKMIRCLAINNEVYVISFRPFSKNNTTFKNLKSSTIIDNNITWQYLKVKRNKISRFVSYKRQIKQLYKKLIDFDLILTDTINPIVLYNATKFAKKTRIPIVGICTDSPSNISGTSKAYTLLLLNLASNLDGYICLTSALNDLFNQNHKPNIIIEGLVESNDPIKNENKYGKYLFFGGALLPRYGVYNLINAFKKLSKPDLKLIICGHHADYVNLVEEIKKEENIIYLSMIPPNEVLSLEANAVACINPRPYSEDLDRYSVPSKTLEYFNSGAPVVSIKNSKLIKAFSEYAIWVKDNDVNSLVNGINLLLNLPSENRKHLAKRAKSEVRKQYSLESVNARLMDFFSNFNR